MWAFHPLAGLSFSEDDTSALTPVGYGCPFGKLIKLMINPFLSTDYWERGLTYRAYSLNPHSAYREARNPPQILGRHPFSGSVCLSEPLGKLNNITTGLPACAVCTASLPVPAVAGRTREDTSLRHPLYGSFRPGLMLAGRRRGELPNSPSPSRSNAGQATA